MAAAYGAGPPSSARGRRREKRPLAPLAPYALSARNESKGADNFVACEDDKFETLQAADERAWARAASGDTEAGQVSRVSHVSAAALPLEEHPCGWLLEEALSHLKTLHAPEADKKTAQSAQRPATTQQRQKPAAKHNPLEILQQVASANISMDSTRSALLSAASPEERARLQAHLRSWSRKGQLLTAPLGPSLPAAVAPLLGNEQAGSRPGTSGSLPRAPRWDCASSAPRDEGEKPPADPRPWRNGMRRARMKLAAKVESLDAEEEQQRRDEVARTVSNDISNMFVKRGTLSAIPDFESDSPKSSSSAGSPRHKSPPTGEGSNSATTRKTMVAHASTTECSSHKSAVQTRTTSPQTVRAQVARGSNSRTTDSMPQDSNRRPIIPGPSNAGRNPDKIRDGKPKVAVPSSTGKLDNIVKPGTRDQRMRALDNVRRGQRATQHIGKEDGKIASQAFSRHAEEVPDGRFIRSADKLLEALADCGIQARTTEEKFTLQRALPAVQDAVGEDAETIGFGEFCKVMMEARELMQAQLLPAVLHFWSQLGPRDLCVERDTIMRLLAHLDPDLSNDPEEAGRASAVLEDFAMRTRKDKVDPMQSRKSHVGRIGEYSLAEAKRIAWLVRERKAARMRLKELDLKQKYELDDAMFKAFRLELVDMHAVFQETVQTSSARQDNARGRVKSLIADALQKAQDLVGLPLGEARHILGKLGLPTPLDWDATRLHQQAHKKRTAAMQRQTIHAAEGMLTFSGLLHLVTRRRSELMHEKARMVEYGYSECGRKDAEGNLDCQGIFEILHILGLKSTSQQEHQCIAEVVKELDTDSNDSYTLQELHPLVQRVEEKLAMLKRKGEDALVDKLQIAQDKARVLRDRFDAAASQTGDVVVMREQVGQILQDLDISLTQRELAHHLDKIDEDFAGVTFPRLLHLYHALVQMADAGTPSNASSHTAAHKQSVNFDEMESGSMFTNWAERALTLNEEAQQETPRSSPANSTPGSSQKTLKFGLNRSVTFQVALEETE